MVTSAALYHVLHFFHITIDIRNVCVFLAPLFSSFTTIVTYHFTKELKVHTPMKAYKPTRYVVLDPKPNSKPFSKVKVNGPVK